MQIEQRFTVRAPKDAVWSFLTDPYRVAKCLPGAAVTEQVDGSMYAGTITVKVGPVSTSYRGTVRFERLDAEAGEAVLAATGQDVRGKGGAELRMTSRLTARGPSETEVAVLSEVAVTGILAQFGRGMIQDVSDQMFQQFTAAMRAQLEGAAGGAPPAPALAAPPALDGLSLGARVAGRATKRLLRRKRFWAAVVLLALLVYWLWLR